MAQYTNLTSLAGLHVGDVVIYNTETDIDLAGSKVKFEVIGNKGTGLSSYNGGYGGYSCGTMSSRSNASVSFNTTYSSCFYLTNGNGTDWRYNRFIVAGNASGSGMHYYSNWSNYSYCDGANGGGLNGQRGKGSTTTAGYGGSQTAGGAPGNYTKPSGKTAATPGSFGPAGTNASNYNSGNGGYNSLKQGTGWYGGGGVGQFDSGGSAASGGGGSGYVLTSTSSKPSGYMTNNDFILEDTVLTTGGAQSASANYANTYNIGVITIIENFDPNTQTKIITNNLGEVTETVIDQGDTITNPGEPTHDSKYLFVCWCSDSALTTEYTFGGSATSDFIYLYAKYYQYVPCKTYKNNNNEIIPCKFYRWNGTSFDQIQINYIETVT